jgi:hypothetical protein
MMMLPYDIDQNGSDKLRKHLRKGNASTTVAEYCCSKSFGLQKKKPE